MKKSYEASLTLVAAGGAAGAEVAGSGEPILIFGWVLQTGYALIPLLFGRAFLAAGSNGLGVRNKSILYRA